MTTTSASSIWFERPGYGWFDGLPIGNGRTGAMVYGDLSRQVVALNDETFWSAGATERDFGDTADALRVTRRSLAEGDPLGAQAAAEALMGSPRLGAAFQPLGSIVLTARHERNPRNFRRTLDLSTGSATFTEEYDAGSQGERELVACREPSVFIIRQAGAAGEIVVTVDSPFPTTGDGMTFVGEWSEVESTRTLVADSYRLRDYPGGRRLRFAIGARVLQGDFDLREGTLVLTSETWTLAVAVATDFDGSEPSTVVAALLERAASSSPADLMHVAKEAHREIFDRAAIELELADPVSSRLRTMPTDARVHAVRAGGVDDDLTLLVADYGRYLMIASGVGGSLPPTLQGVWNEDTEPAWSSNWTLNINAQMNLWSADAFHVTEAVGTLEHLVQRLSVAGERTAREIYGARGWVIHHNADLWLNTAPTTLVEIGFFPAAGLWLLQQLWQHHLHYPEESLDERLVSLFEGCVAFLETWLVEDADGHLVTSPSSTPENAYLLGDTPRPVSRAVDPEYWRHGWLGEAPTLDMWLVRDTLRSAIAAASAAGSPAAPIERWTQMLARLRPVPIIDGEIPEWTWPYRALELGHRHLSPLYAVFPGTDDFVTPSPMADAARRTLVNRQAHVESTSNGWGGWSRVWAGASWARLRDGDRALASVESLLRTGIAPGSLLHAFPDFDGHPAADAVHQSDANMGLPAVICELVMQSTAGTITLLPALPRRWTAGRVRALRARGGIDVTFEWHDAAVTVLQLDSTRDQRLQIVTPRETRDVQLVAGVPLLLTFDESPSGGRKETDS